MAPRPAIPGVDGLRGLAALLVAAYHAWLLSGQAPLGDSPLRDALSSGHFAVTYFFVLSGCVLFWPAALAGGDLGGRGAYFLRRVARIVPAYYVALALGALLFGLLVAGPVTLGDRVTPGSVAAHLLLVHNEARLIPGYHGALGWGVNPALWTLSVEWAFYLVLPFVAAPFARRPLVLLAGALAVAAAGRIWLAHAGLSDRTTALLLSSAPLQAADFAAGMTVAWLLARAPQRLGRTPWARPAALAAAAALLVIMVVAGDPNGAHARDVARSSAVLAVVLPLLTAVVGGGVALAPPGVLTGRPARWLGQVSYGIFLGHLLVLGFARATLGVPVDGSVRAFLLMESVVLAGGVLYGWLSWRLVEAPARRWARRLSTSRTPRSSPSAPPVAQPDRAPG